MLEIIYIQLSTVVTVPALLWILDFNLTVSLIDQIPGNSVYVERTLEVYPKFDI